MINLAHERRKRSCYDKRRFSDEFAARAVGIEVMGVNGRSMRVYRCAECRGWHLATKSGGGKNAVGFYLRGRPDAR